MDDPNLEDNNVDEKVKLFVDAAHHQVWCNIKLIFYVRSAEEPENAFSPLV